MAARQPTHTTGLGIVHQPGQPIRPEEHHPEGHQTQGQKQHQGQAENAVDLVPPVQGVGLADQLGHGHGQARRGDGQQNGIDIVGVVEICGALLADDVDQGNFIEHSDELDHPNSHRQKGRAAEKGALLLGGRPVGRPVTLCHKASPS